jgi:cell fate (sporulation/competence/biofilm development) regulator YlbF (YheA/YmcA/DUF963 family)
MSFSILDKIVELSKSFEKPFQKQLIVNKIEQEFGLLKDRKLYFNDNLALRFSDAKTGYSNTFLGFQKILDHDDKPLIACIIRKDYLEFLLANSTFINCISHSSKNLADNHIRGSANLSNIIREFSSLKNERKNFAKLFEIHKEVPQKDNIERIVEATKNIIGQVQKFEPSKEQMQKIYSSAQFIQELEKKAEFQSFENELIKRVGTLKDIILATSKIDNVNLRGNKIENLVTSGTNSHDLGDILRTIGDAKVIIDVKSKLLNFSSAPKAYNIDKLLKELSQGKTYFGYLFIGVDYNRNEVKVKLISFIDEMMIENTTIQHHWSGLNSRGTAQLNDNIKVVFNENFTSKINIDNTKEFLKKLIEL